MQKWKKLWLGLRKKNYYQSLALLLIALIASISLNYLTFTYARQYYFQLNETRLDPLGLNYYPAEVDQPTPANPEQIRVVFFGDSRAADWVAPSGLGQFQFINRGIGAQTSAQVVERFDEHIVPLQPQIIILQLCINDLKTIPLFPHLREPIIANCQRNINRIVSEAQELGATVIVTTIFPLGEIPIERRLFWSAEVARAIEEMNSFIYMLQEEKVIIFDSAAVLVNEKGVVRKEYSRDFLHLNKVGYAALNRELTSILVVAAR